MKHLLLLATLFTVSNASALGNSYAKQAQTVLNQINQGRACTSFTKTSLETTIDSASAEYMKRRLLISFGVVKSQLHKSGNLTWERYTNVPLDESKGKGVWIQDGQITYYCFGWWKVTDAKPTDKAAAPAGQRMLLATVVLQGADQWFAKTPAAIALMRPSFNGDNGALPALNQYDKVVPMSLSKPNLVLIPVNK